MEGHLNYLFFVLSLLSRTDTVIYQAEVEGIGDAAYPAYRGVQTNEAVTKFLIDYLHNKGECLNKIIMLCTPEVLKNKLSQIEGQTTCEYYQKEVRKYIQERNYPEMVNTEHLFEEVSYFPEKNENENQIINKLEEIVQPNKREEYPKRLFVDFTGGNRSSALTVVFACRILDKYGMEVGKILYSNLRNTENGIVGRIEECTQTYRIFSEFERALMIENNIVMNVPESADEQIKDTEKSERICCRPII